MLVNEFPETRLIPAVALFVTSQIAFARTTPVPSVEDR